LDGIIVNYVDQRGRETVTSRLATVGERILVRVYLGFDDTDTIESDRGTGKLARWFEDVLPRGYHFWGVIRQQLLIHQDIPYTSHNSSACVILETDACIVGRELISAAVEHVEQYAVEGSDPGICVAHEEDPNLADLVAFGRACTTRMVTQNEAFKAAKGMHLSGHGGSNDGIIGAAAAVGLTAYGWGGRFIEFGRLRALPDQMSVQELEKSSILVVSVDRDGKVPAPGDMILTGGWLRPRLWGGGAVLSVIPRTDGVWECLDKKRGKHAAGAASAAPLSC